MIQIKDGLPFEILVEVIAAHDSQSLDGTPEGRIIGRILRSIELARQAGLCDLKLYLDKRDQVWLCAAYGIDRLSSQAKRLRVGGLVVDRAKVNYESHLMGMRCRGGVERVFPIIADPSQTPGFTQYVPTAAEKVALVEKFKSDVLNEALGVPPRGMWN